MAQELPGGQTPQRRSSARRGLLQPLRITGRLSVWIVDRSVQVVWVHYVAPRTLPCRLMFGELTCSHCTDRLPRKRQGWLTVQDTAVSRPPSLLCLTQHVLWGCPTLLQNEGHLYARRLAVWRQPAHLMGAMYAELARDVCGVRLWEAPDTWTTLLKMWSAESRSDWTPTLRLHQPDQTKPPSEGGSEVAGP